MKEAPNRCYMFSWSIPRLQHSTLALNYDLGPMSGGKKERLLPIVMLGAFSSRCKPLRVLSANPDIKMMHLTQSSNKLPTYYAKAIRNKVLSCDRVYEECVLKRIIVEVLPNCMQEGAHSYLDSKKKGTVLERARQPPLLNKLHHGSRNTEEPKHHIKTNTRRGNQECRAENVSITKSASLSSTGLSRKSCCTNMSSLWSPPHALTTVLEVPPHMLQPFFRLHQWWPSTMCHFVASVSDKQTDDKMSSDTTTAPSYTDQQAWGQLAIYIKTPSMAPTERIQLQLTARNRKLDTEHVMVDHSGL